MSDTRSTGITQCYKCELFKEDSAILHVMMPDEIESHQPVCSDCLHEKTEFDEQMRIGSKVMEEDQDILQALADHDKGLTESCGNVFKDLGLPDAEKRLELAKQGYQKFKEGTKVLREQENKDFDGESQ
jgi:hypothetical protein